MIARRSIVIPLRNVCEGFNLLREGAALGAERDAAAVDPDILGDDFSELFSFLGLVFVLIVEAGVICSLHFYSVTSVSL